MKTTRHCAVRTCKRKSTGAYSRFCQAHADLWVHNGWREAYVNALTRDRIDIVTKFEFHPNSRP